MIGLSGLSSIARALRNPNYRIYTAGSAVSLVGTWMQRVAVGWLTWQLTESGAWLGAIAFADLFPSVIFGLVAGAAADRWNRLRVTKISQCLAMIQSLLLFGLTASGAITIELLFALTGLLGIVVAFNQPARLALIPSLVRNEDMPAAVALNSVVFNSARFVGPAAAGLVIVGGGVSAAFLANAVSFALFLVALARVNPRDETPWRPSERGLFGESAEGLRYTVGHPGIGPLLLLLIVVCVCARPFVELLPGFAADVFEAGAPALAFLTAAVGLGAIGGGLWLAQRGDTDNLIGVILGNTLGLALALLLFVGTDRLWLAGLALLIAGVCVAIGGVGTQTLLQLAVDSSMRGRVLSLYGMIFRGGPAVSALLMGTAADHVGLRWPLAFGTVIVFLAVLWTKTRRRRMASALEPVGAPAQSASPRSASHHRGPS